MRLAVLLALLLAPGASAMAAQSLAGDGVASSNRGVADGHGPWQFQGGATIEVHDDIFYAPLANPTLYAHHDRESQSYSTLGHASVSGAIAPGSRILVLPTNATISAAGPWALTSGPEHLLEDSHAFDASSGNPQYYAHQAPEGLNWTSEAASLDIEGSFDVYVWGQELLVEDAAGQRRVRTGHWAEPWQGVGEAEHYSFAIIHASGRLTMDPAAVAMYAPEVQVQSGLQVTGGAGLVHADGATYLIEGDALLEGGQHRIHYQDGRLHVDSMGIRTVSGAQPLPEVSAWILPVAILGGALATAAMLAALALRGHLGASPTWEDRAKRVRPDWAAEACLRLATRIDPLRGSAHWELANLLVAKGKDAGAVVHWAMAHQNLTDQVQRAQAAYAVSCHHAYRLDPEASAEWLERAIQCDSRMAQVASEAGTFVAVQDDPRFQARVGWQLTLGAPS